jgi:glycosyltransferase involved in cell wall biosynthesis
MVPGKGRSVYMREKISVVMIVRDEEDRIARSLESVKWADEVIVVDDNSSDRTTEIARSMGASVITSESGGNFDRQRNLGIESASGDWILQMDADEVVPDELRAEILSVLESGSSSTAYKFRRKNFFLGHFMRYGGWFNEFSTKLFRKGEARYTGKSVHETLEVYGDTGNLDACIEHYPFKSITQFISRQNYYSSVEAKVLLEEKGRISEKEIRRNLRALPFRSFWKSYVKNKGYREGMHGLIFCVLFAWVHFLKWAKYWQLIDEEKRDDRKN